MPTVVIIGTTVVVIVTSTASSTYQAPSRLCWSRLSQAFPTNCTVVGEREKKNRFVYQVWRVVSLRRLSPQPPAGGSSTFQLQYFNHTGF